MGSPIKKAVSLTGHANPHTWFMSNRDAARYTLAGQITGANDKYYKPEDQPQIPYHDPMADAVGARDRQRRLAMRAQGMASTIRAGSLATPVSSSPAKLLGS